MHGDLCWGQDVTRFFLLLLDSTLWLDQNGIFLLNPLSNDSEVLSRNNVKYFKINNHWSLCFFLYFLQFIVHFSFVKTSVLADKNSCTSAWCCFFIVLLFSVINTRWNEGQKSNLGVFRGHDVSVHDIESALFSFSFQQSRLIKKWGGYDTWRATSICLCTLGPSNAAVSLTQQVCWNISSVKYVSSVCSFNSFKN